MTMTLPDFSTLGSGAVPALPATAPPAASGPAPRRPRSPLPQRRDHGPSWRAVLVTAVVVVVALAAGVATWALRRDGAPARGATASPAVPFGTGVAPAV